MKNKQLSYVSINTRVHFPSAPPNFACQRKALHYGFVWQAFLFLGYVVCLLILPFIQISNKGSQQHIELMVALAYLIVTFV